MVKRNGPSGLPKIIGEIRSRQPITTNLSVENRRWVYSAAAETGESLSVIIDTAVGLARRLGHLGVGDELVISSYDEEERELVFVLPFPLSAGAFTKEEYEARRLGIAQSNDQAK